MFLRWTAKRPGWKRIQGRRKPRPSGDLTRYRSRSWKRTASRRRGGASFW